ARQDLDERTEGRGALYDALVDLAYLGLLDERLDHVARPLAPFTHRGNRDQAVVVHVDFGAGLLLDAPDGLALGADQVADLVRPDLDRDDARRVLGQLRARLRDRLIHDVEDVQPRLLRLLERLGDDLEVEAHDLDVHLDRRDALARARDLEVHVAQGVFGAQDVREHRHPVRFLDEPHRDAGARGGHRYPGVEQRERAAAHRGHGRRAVRLEDVGYDADGVGELVVRRQQRLQRPLGQRAVPHL